MCPVFLFVFIYKTKYIIYIHQRTLTPHPPTMNSLVLILPPTVSDEACYRLIQRLEDLSVTDTSLAFEQICVQEQRNVGRKAALICQLAVPDPTDTATTTRTCSEIDDVVKLWMTQTGHTSKISFQVSRLIIIPG